MLNSTKLFTVIHKFNTNKYKETLKETNNWKYTHTQIKMYADGNLKKKQDSRKINHRH